MCGPSLPLEQLPHTPPRTQAKLLVCEIWKRHVVVQFVQYTSQVGCRYAPPQQLKNERRRAGWLWWTSPLAALSFFSVWLPWLPRGQHGANLSYWSEAALRFLPPTSANEQTIRTTQSSLPHPSAHRNRASPRNTRPPAYNTGHHVRDALLGTWLDRICEGGHWNGDMCNNNHLALHIYLII